MNKSNKMVFNFVMIIALIVVLILDFVQIFLLSHHITIGQLDITLDIGDLINIIVSLFLGFVVTLQTRNTNILSKRMADIDEKNFELGIYPFIDVTGWEAIDLSNEWNNIFYSHSKKIYICLDNSDVGDNILGLKIHLENTTHAFLTAEYSWTLYGSEKLEKGGRQNFKLYLHPSEEGEIILYAKNCFMRKLIGKNCTLRFILENCIANRYEETFELMILALDDDNGLEEGCFCSCNIQNYNVIKL